MNCGRSYKRKAHLARHQKYECGKMPIFHCSICNYKCHRRDAMRQHLLSKKHENKSTNYYNFSDNENYSCPTCRKMYKHLGNLTRHQKYECGKRAEFQCPFCNYKCHRKDVLKVHLKNTKKHQHVDFQTILCYDSKF
ncbi:Zinc finger, C2H2 type [Popillia japonica]|uniref:Zinc finger, C2H2 type n=1 Tax=Popillia japonica TaxID=7064 RepID=A0AAW1MM08_POPJA